MTQLLEPADVEQALIDELSSQFTIGTSIPEDPLPAAFLRVNSGGGFQRDLVTDRFIVTLDSFAKLETIARSNLVRAVALVQRAVLAGSLGGVPAYRLEVSGLPQNLPHPTVTDRARYIATLAPDLRRQTITL